MPPSTRVTVTPASQDNPGGGRRVFLARFEEMKGWDMDARTAETMLCSPGEGRRSGCPRASGPASRLGDVEAGEHHRRYRSPAGMLDPGSSRGGIESFRRVVIPRFVRGPGTAIRPDSRRCTGPVEEEVGGGSNPPSSSESGLSSNRRLVDGAQVSRRASRGSGPADGARPAIERGALAPSWCRHPGKS